MSSANRRARKSGNSKRQSAGQTAVFKLVEKLGGQVTIGGMVIPVVVKEMDDCVGCWIGVEQKIYLSPDQTRQCAVDTLIHEVIHAASDIFDLGIGHKSVYSLTCALLQALRPLLLRRY